MLVSRKYRRRFYDFEKKTKGVNLNIETIELIKTIIEHLAKMSIVNLSERKS